MKLLKYASLLFLFIIWGPLLKAQNSSKLNAIDIVKKSIDAVGGETYLRSIKTLYTNTKTIMEGREVNWIVKEMLPNKGSFQIVYKGRVVFQSWFDGKEGYETVNGEVKKADPADFADKVYKQNIFNALDYINPTLWTLELVGEEKVGDANCYKIKGTLKNGKVELFYFDKTSYLALKNDVIENNNKSSFSTVIYSNFKKFGNLIYSTEEKLSEGNDIKTTKLEELLINEKITESDFRPEKK